MLIEYWDFNNILHEILSLAMLLPVYIVGFLYAFKANYLWQIDGRFRFYNQRKTEI